MVSLQHPKRSPKGRTWWMGGVFVDGNLRPYKPRSVDLHQPRFLGAVGWGVRRWMSRWKLGSVANKWVISPTSK